MEEIQSPISPTGFQGRRRHLSPYQEAKVKVGELTFPTAEHAYQAAKSLDLKDWKRIQKSPSPGAARQLGEQLQVRPDWEEIRVEVLRHVTYAKFDQNPDLRARLLSNQDKDFTGHYPDLNQILIAYRNAQS